MKGFVSIRQFSVVGLVGSVAVVSVACLTLRPASALWLLPVGLSLELLAMLWVRSTSTHSIREILSGVEAEPALAIVPRNRPRTPRTQEY